VILVCTVLTQYSRVTDERTDGRTGGQTPRPWLRRAKQYAIARKNYRKRLWNCRRLQSQSRRKSRRLTSASALLMCTVACLL